MSGLVIHALKVQGGILALSGLPGRDGDYWADLAHLREWRPSLVISMTTEAELVAVGGADIGSDINGMGTRWAHLPLEDFGAPDAKIDAAWPGVSKTVLAALKGGGRVLVHCRGGCGRSGMVVLRLMVAAGEAPDVALARLRDVRPCAVETEAQMTWACRAPDAPLMFVHKRSAEA